ncbi:MAG: hypothetical protein AAF899_00010 [Pseudomonadota bacterium]
MAGGVTLPPLGALAHVWLVPAAMVAGEWLVDLESDGGAMQMLLLGLFLLGAPLLAGWAAARLDLPSTPTLVVAGVGLAIYWVIVLWRVNAAGPEAAGWLPVVVALAAGQISVSVSTAWAMLRLRANDGQPLSQPVTPPGAKAKRPFKGPSKRPVAKGPRRKGKS